MIVLAKSSLVVFLFLASLCLSKRLAASKFWWRRNTRTSTSSSPLGDVPCQSLYQHNFCHKLVTVGYMRYDGNTMIMMFVGQEINGASPWTGSDLAVKYSFDASYHELNLSDTTFYLLATF